jgi:hypothetical protein
MSVSCGSDVHRVVWPRGRTRVETVQLAPRLSGLEGTTVAMLWDYVFRGDEIFPVLEAELARRFPRITFVPYAEFGATFGGDEHRTIAGLPGQLERHGVDAVVSGMGC